MLIIAGTSIAAHTLLSVFVSTSPKHPMTLSTLSSAQHAPSGSDAYLQPITPLDLSLANAQGRVIIDDDHITQNLTAYGTWMLIRRIHIE